MTMRKCLYSCRVRSNFIIDLNVSECAVLEPPRHADVRCWCVVCLLLEADLARSLLFSISNDIGQIASLYALMHSLKKVSHQFKIQLGSFFFVIPYSTLYAPLTQFPAVFDLCILTSFLVDVFYKFVFVLCGFICYIINVGLFWRLLSAQPPVVNAHGELCHQLLEPRPSSRPLLTPRRLLGCNRSFPSRSWGVWYSIEKRTVRGWITTSVAPSIENSFPIFFFKMPTNIRGRRITLAVRGFRALYLATNSHRYQWPSMLIN